MNALLLDRDGAASRLAAEGKFALGRGETTVAAEKYAAAGEALERSMESARKASDRHLLRFLAATQYYLGGHYKKALKLANRIEAPFLEPETRNLLPKFLKDVRERSAPDYLPRMRDRMVQLWQAGQFEQALNTLKDHHFVYEQGPLAFLRAVLCEELRQWKAAAVFYAMAIPGAKDGSDFMLMAVGRALGLPSEGRVAEAWEYISRLRELLPNAVTNLVASITCFFRASNATGDERLALHREQLRYFQDGVRAYQELPAERKQHPEMRAIVSMGSDAAAVALVRLKDTDLARAIAEQAIPFEAKAPRHLGGEVVEPDLRAWKSGGLPATARSRRVRDILAGVM